MASGAERRKQAQGSGRARDEPTGRGPRVAKPRGMHPALQRYYAGEPVPCPVGCGGAAQVVRRATQPDGGGELWFECGSCAQRDRYDVPSPTPSEARTVVESAADGRPLTCPRHVEPVVLERQGRRMMCPDCGVAFKEQ